MQKATISEYLLDSLYARGVAHIFGVPGDYVLKLNKRIEQHPHIKFINTTRESTAGYMADAYARLCGLGVACITYGVGVNITNALAQSLVESTPLVVISGSAGAAEYLNEIKLHHLINKSVSELSDTTQLEIFKHVTIAQAVLDNPKTAKKQIDEILDICFKNKKPIYIEMPRDMVDAPLPEDSHPTASSYPTSDQDTLHEALTEITKMIDKCRRPVIWAGHEIQRYGLANDMLKFAESFHVPIVTSLLGKSIISEYHPLCAGVYQGGMSRPEVIELMDNCDCVFMLGLLLTDIDTGIFTAKLDHEQHLIANAETFEIGHHQYQKIHLTDFIPRLAGMKSNRNFKDAYPTSFSRKIAPFKPKASTKITTERVFECIQHHLNKNTIVVTDVGDCLFGSADLILEQDSFLACAYFASLGFGTPGSIAAQLALPHRRTVGIIGDGAFQMTSMELSTAVRYQLDPIIIILNNHGYGTERPILEGTYNDIQDWNYAALPLVLKGGIGIQVDTEEGLDAALKKALAERGAFHLIEVELGKTDFSNALQRFEHLIEQNVTKKNE